MHIYVHAVHRIACAPSSLLDRILLPTQEQVFLSFTSQNWCKKCTAAAIMTHGPTKKSFVALTSNMQKHAALNGLLNLPLNALCYAPNVPFPLHD